MTNGWYPWVARLPSTAFHWLGCSVHVPYTNSTGRPPTFKYDACELRDNAPAAAVVIVLMSVCPACCCSSTSSRYGATEKPGCLDATWARRSKRVVVVLDPFHDATKPLIPAPWACTTIVSTDAGSSVAYAPDGRSYHTP